MVSKKLQLLSLILVLLSMVTKVQAQNSIGTSLYGISPGIELKDLPVELAKESFQIPLSDGWVVHVYQLKRHNVIIETTKSDPNYVAAVQIEGYENPQGKGLLGLNLGDSKSTAIKLLGAPTSSSEAIDEKTGKAVPETIKLAYPEFSIEVTKDKVSSIKLLFPPRTTSKADQDSTNKFNGTNRQQAWASTVDALKNYLLNDDYPEAFGGKHYRVKIDDMVMADIDGDGEAELIVLTKPHYRQSPTILIFKISAGEKAVNIKKVVEGLAPGPLVGWTGDYLDSHELGMAVDLTVTGMKHGYDPIQFIETSRKSGMGGAVQYKEFMHFDGRSGTGSYVDMTHVDVPGDGKSCELFEFSTITNISAGYLKKNDNHAYIVAATKDAIYAYRINKIDDLGYLGKSEWQLPLPTDFESFAPFNPNETDGFVRYMNHNGKSNTILLDENSRQLY